MAGNGGEQGDDLAFLKEAVESLKMPGLAAPMLLSVILLPATNILLLFNLPTRAEPDHGPYLAAFAAALVVHAALAIAILRILNGSPRPAWSPDWSAWAYGLVILAEFAIGLFSDAIMSRSPGIMAVIASEIVSTAIIVPLAPWFVAIAVDRPLAWNPAPWFRRARIWLPALLLWNFLILAPAGVAYRLVLETSLAEIDRRDWPWFILHGVVTAALMFLALALASVAYRRIARDRPYGR
ncbi:MAG TPA: hypothetical protein VIT45_03135 [Allosphingosinicella sp.]